MKREQQGVWQQQSVADEPFLAFLPFPLPPNPPLAVDAAMLRRLSKADQMLGRLDGLARILPQPELLIDFYIRKEAVLSSQIEGTQSTLTDLLLFELEPDSGDEDTIEVSNYVDALRHGIRRLRSGFPLSNRLVKEMHAILLRSGRGSTKTPGEFRLSQNWIGGTRPGNALFVPPSVLDLPECMSDLEKFLHGAATDLPVVVQCALVHVQFETIHPFLDGNGRLGRLLITLLLMERGVQQQPLLYFSLYLKHHRDVYYRLLQQVRLEGVWEEWIQFFAEAVASTAEAAVSLAAAIFDLFRRDELRLTQSRPRVGSALQVLQQLQKTPYTSPARLAERTGLSFNTVVSALGLLQGLGMVTEMVPRPGRIVCYLPYLTLLEEGASPEAATSKLS